MCLKGVPIDFSGDAEVSGVFHGVVRRSRRFQGRFIGFLRVSESSSEGFRGFQGISYDFIWFKGNAMGFHGCSRGFQERFSGFYRVLGGSGVCREIQTTSGGFWAISLIFKRFQDSFGVSGASQ